MQFRQGDVLITPIAARPATATEIVARERGRVILAHGELTGHAHAIARPNATLFRDPKLAKVFLSVTGAEPALLEHEEHSTIVLEPGDYEVRGQREYSPEAIRNVAD